MQIQIADQARIKAWFVKYENQTSHLLAEMTEELYHLWYSIDEDAQLPTGGLCSLLGILQAAQVTAISLFYGGSSNVDT
jgi:hypothetical protein